MFKKYFSNDYKMIFNDNTLDDVIELSKYKIDILGHFLLLLRKRFMRKDYFLASYSRRNILVLVKVLVKIINIP